MAKNHLQFKCDHSRDKQSQRLTVVSVPKLLLLTCSELLDMYECVRVSPHPLSDAFVLGQGDDGLDVFVGQLGHSDALVSAGDVIGQDDCGKHWEAVSHVQRAVVVVVVDARQFLRGKKKKS